MKEAAKQEMRFIAFGVTFGESGVRVIAPSLPLTPSLTLPLQAAGLEGGYIEDSSGIVLGKRGSGERERERG